jgi:hypothetical protein
MPIAAVRARLEPLLVDGLVATCGIIDLEIGFSAQDRRGPSRRSPRTPVAARCEER